MNSDPVAADSLPETGAASLPADTPTPVTASNDASTSAQVDAPAAASDEVPASAPVDAPAVTPDVTPTDVTPTDVAPADVTPTDVAPADVTPLVPAFASASDDTPPAAPVDVPAFAAVETPAPEPEVAPQVAPGEILRLAREARGESISDIVHTLKLSQQQLEAIESGRFSALPGPTFVRGFVRNYARHLGLDPAPLLAGLEGGPEVATALAPVVSNVKGHVSAAMVSSSRIGAPRINFLPLLLAVLLLAALVGAGFHFGWFEALQEWGHPSLPDNPAEPVLLNKPAEPISSGRSVVVPIAAPVPESIDPEGARALAAVGQGGGNMAAVLESVSSSSTVLAPGAAASIAPVAPVVPAVPVVSTLNFSFGSNAWIEVREGNESGGKLLFVGTGNAGSSRKIRGTPPFSLVVSKADRVKLEFNGKQVDLKPYADQKMNARLTLQ
jgi:cytoskeleton protein RodZ